MKQPIEPMSLLRGKGRALRPERSLARERLVRHELALHRLLAISRRAASNHMSALRRAQPVMLIPDAAAA